MKKVLIALAAVVVILVVAVVVVPTLIPAETYKSKIVEAARDATGRELSLDGDISLSVLPRLELRAEQVAFANAPGAAAPQMASLEALVLELQLWPLLSGAVKVDSFVLVRPVINLEIDKDGRPNWDFGIAQGTDQTGGAPAPTAETAQEPAEATAPGGPASLPEISLGDVRLEDGLVTFRDARSGQVVEISDIRMTLSLPDLDSPVRAEGSLVWNEETLNLELETENLRGLMAGRTTPISLALQSNPVTLGYGGSLTKAATPKIEGDLDLNVPSIRDLAAWTGNPLDAPGEGLGPLRIKGRIDATDKVFSFSQASIALDEMTASGDLMADIGGKVPYLNGRLDVDHIDLNTYLPPPEEGQAAGGQASGGQASGGGTSGGQASTDQAAAGPGEWSDEPIALEGLKAANVDFALSVGAIKVQKMEIGRSALTVALKDGLLNLDLKELNLYGGAGKGTITVDGRGAVPGVAKTFVLEGIQAQPFLRDAAGFDRLTGTGRMDISITAKGRSQKEMVSALNGKGAIKFIDGAITGINLAAMARNLESAFLNAGDEEAQKTDFAELSGTFKITKGILRNDDLTLLNPLLRLAGRGSSDLPKRTVDYRLEPKLVASLEGQGGDAGSKGLVVPVIVEGPWHDLSYRPDLAGLVGDLAKDPSKALEGAKETVKQLQEGAGGDIGDVIKNIVKPPAEDSEQGGAGSLIPDPGKALKSLFGD